jgi:transposase-like protein
MNNNIFLTVKFFINSYKCEGCKREFNRRDNMKTHMKRCAECKFQQAE